MSRLLDAPAPRWAAARVTMPPHRVRYVVLVAAALAVGSRIPFLGRPAGSDEAGFLMVAAQWHHAGTSLYGNYWVDRPPLLITIFQAAAAAGGLTALRLIGCVAVAALVVTAAGAAGAIAAVTHPGGVRSHPARAGAARCWAAVTAAVLCVTPLMGATRVNGELLAAPIVASGIWAAVAAADRPEGRSRTRLAMLAGAAAVSALLVKQNFADVIVFGVVASVAAVRSGSVVPGDARRLLAAALRGATIVLLVVAAWTLAHGTSLGGVFDAMYPFRLQAHDVLSADGPPSAAVRRDGLVAAAVASGAVVLIVVALGAWLFRRWRGAAAWGVVAVIAFDIASIDLGGNYWTHYLVQLIVPLSIATGVLVAQGSWLLRPLVFALAVVSLVAWHGAATRPAHSDGAAVGKAIAGAASPRDTIVTAYGSSQIDLAAGLSSPYENLWSLPVKVRDAHLTRLDAVLTGPSAPTWLVTTHHITSWGLDTAHTRRIVAGDYHVVARLCARTVYLRDGVRRPVPRLSDGCAGTDANTQAVAKEQP